MLRMKIKKKIQLNTLIIQYFILHYIQHVSAEIQSSSGRQNTGGHTMYKRINTLESA